MKNTTEIQIQTMPTCEIHDQHLSQLALVAAKGFGDTVLTERMINDTREHIESADHVQLVSGSRGYIGFALYKELLWR